jgi:UDP-2,3-diacylglucosamine hydrolase
LFGDVFDYWIGPAFGFRCSYRPVLETFQAARREGFPIDFIAGNRDFMGPGELRRMGLTVYGDAVLYDRQGSRTLVTHGDLLVKGDVKYRRFRLWARSWPLRLGYRLVPQHARLAMALYMRGRSKKSLAMVKQTAYPVDAELAERWLLQHEATEILMGHLHREEVHEHSEGRRTLVMPGWSSRQAPHFVLGPPAALETFLVRGDSAPTVADRPL